MTAERFDNAIATVSRRLGLSDEVCLGADELALVLAALATEQAVRALGSVAEIRTRLSARDSDAARTDVARALATALDPFAEQAGIAAKPWHALTAHPQIDVPSAWREQLLAPSSCEHRKLLLQRAAQLALESLSGERVAPEMHISPLPLGAQELSALLPGLYLHGLIFGESLHVANELFPLMLDAYDHDLAACGEVMTCVVGVHVDWLNPNGDAARVLLYEPRREALRELPLASPRRLDSVHFLYLGRREQERHRELSERFHDRTQVNPFACARLADDKQACFERLQKAGVATPRSLLLRDASDLAGLTERFAAAGLPPNGRLVVQPRRGTEGQGVTGLSLASDDAARLGAALAELRELLARHGELVVREYVPGLRFADGAQSYAADLRLNVSWDGQAFSAESGYVQVAGAPEALASSVGRGGRVVAFSQGGLSGMGLSTEDLALAQQTACAAAAALANADAADVAPVLTPLRLTGVDLRLDRRGDVLHPVVLDLNPRPAGLSYSELIATREPGVSLGLWRSLMLDNAISHILTIVREDRDDDHRPLLDGLREPAALRALIDALRAYLRLEPNTNGQAKVLLLQERAILILGDALWRLKRMGALPGDAELGAILADLSRSDKTREDIRCAARDRALEGESAGESEYLAFINQFLAAVNEREMRDFALAKEELLNNVPRRKSAELRLRDLRARYEAVCPMRVGLSSANASDNWTFSKLRGGAVVNFAVDLALGTAGAPHAPISAELTALPTPTLELRTISHLQTDRPTELILDRKNAIDFLALPEGSAAEPARCFRDIQDPLLLLKYALVFAGIVDFKRDPQAYCAEPTRVLDDVLRFSGGRGLRLTLRSEGPSRSGFASSSCVALALLQVLYAASAQDELTQRETLSSLALLLENEVGLKSGKQDTDGPLYAGVKSLRYRPTDGFLASDVTPLALNEAALNENLTLANSGIQRPPASGLRRGLNMRHYSYVSRDPRRFPAVMRSLEVHEAILEALVAGDWPRLGALFGEYLDLRETIDPGATQSIHDEAAGTAVLRLPFQRLKQQGLIYGGMYSGAMGGGCMMLVATPLGRELVRGADDRRVTRLAAALEELRDFVAGENRPFAGLEIYRYAVNARGLECRVHV
jgi:galactokinase/mevalonate kinase-like predicted kinase